MVSKTVENKTFEQTMGEVMSGTLFITRKFMSEVETLFMERLNNDEKLGKIIRENDVDVEKVLFTNINYTYNDGGMDAIVSVMPELAKHFLKSESVIVRNVAMNLFSNFNEGVLTVVCRVIFDTKLVFPEVFGTSQGVNFEYKDDFGTTCDNEAHFIGTNLRKLQATFKLTTPLEVVDVFFEVMHNLVKEENE